jgi:hypothetical protein
MKSRNRLYREAKGLLAGLNKHTSLPITHVTAATLDVSIATARARSLDYDKAKADTRAAQCQVRLLNERARKHATVCRDTLALALSDSWSSAWVPAGWRTPNTLSLPESAEDVVELCVDLAKFLTDNSSLGNPQYKVTAPETEAHASNLGGGLQALADARSEQRKMRDARNAAQEALVVKMRSLRKELEAILTPDDPRWMDFVREVPGDDARPEAVEALEVEGAGPGALDAAWEPSVRAERYLVEVQVVGQDEEFRRVTTVRDASATLTGLPSGAQVKVRVVAANEAGESAPSEAVEVSVPIAQAA